MIDLHTHSLFSDGENTPTELVRMAKEAGLVAFSVSDHDTIEGIPEALEAGKQWGVRVIPAVEISVSYRGKPLHLLWYGMDITNVRFLEMLSYIRSHRRSRIEKIVEALNEELIFVNKKPISLEIVTKLSSIDRPVSRVHIAQYLLNAGYVSEIQEAFDLYLKRLNFAKNEPPIEEAIAIVQQAKWVTVLAHPSAQTTSLSAITSSLNEQEDMIRELIHFGLDGIEVYRYGQSNEAEVFYASLANQYGLLATGGSDFHGVWTLDVPWVGNNNTPDQVLEILSGKISF